VVISAKVQGMKVDRTAPRNSFGVSALGENQEESLRASSVRVGLGLFSVIALPFFFPKMASFLGVLLAYSAATIFFHFAIRHRMGGVVRVLAGGVMDVAFTTFLIHRMGSESTPLLAAYALLGMFNALVAPAWAARVVGGLGVLAYAAVSYGEVLGFLQYAPDFPEMTAFHPTMRAATRSIVILSALVLMSTWVADRIARVLRLREHELRVANGMLEELSQRDPLTQLYNRRYFVTRAEEELERVRRGHAVAVLMMDLDGFKHVNDEQGHIAGDQLLRRIARAIEESTRIVDVIGRFGGDEFVVLLPDTDLEQALIVAERLVTTLRHVGTEADPKRPVTASIGLSLAHPEDDVAILLNSADDAAYRAKQAGGDRFLVATQPDRESFASGPRVAGTG
jgi:diguanylate cyclase (GGDEF)-like protein